MKWRRNLNNLFLFSSRPEDEDDDEEVAAVPPKMNYKRRLVSTLKEIMLATVRKKLRVE